MDVGLGSDEHKRRTKATNISVLSLEDNEKSVIRIAFEEHAPLPAVIPTGAGASATVEWRDLLCG